MGYFLQQDCGTTWNLAQIAARDQHYANPYATRTPDIDPHISVKEQDHDHAVDSKFQLRTRRAALPDSRNVDTDVFVLTDAFSNLETAGMTALLREQHGFVFETEAPKTRSLPSGVKVLSKYRILRCEHMVFPDSSEKRFSKGVTYVRVKLPYRPMMSAVLEKVIEFAQKKEDRPGFINEILTAGRTGDGGEEVGDVGDTIHEDPLEGAGALNEGGSRRRPSQELLLPEDEEHVSVSNQLGSRNNSEFDVPVGADIFDLKDEREIADRLERTMHAVQAVAYGIEVGRKFFGSGFLASYEENPV